MHMLCSYLAQDSEMHVQDYHQIEDIPGAPHSQELAFAFVIWSLIKTSKRN